MSRTSPTPSATKRAAAEQRTRALPARIARERARFDTKTAAKRLGITPAHLLLLERTGFPYYLAERAATLYGAGLADFLRPSSSGDGSGERRGQGVSHRPPAPAGEIESFGDAAAVALAEAA